MLDCLGSKHALLYTFLVTISFSLFRLKMLSKSNYRGRTGKWKMERMG